MFNKLKQFQDLRKQAKDIESMLGAETVEVEKNGAKLVMNGNQKAISFSVPENMSSQEIEKLVPEMINEGGEKVKKILAAKMQSGELSMPQF